MSDKQITEKQARKALQDRAKKIDENDARKMLEHRTEIEEKFSHKGPLGRFLSDAKLMISMVKDYVNGSYREVPWFTIAAVVAALLYVLSPIDLIPDVIPVIGYVDDAMVVVLCLNMVESDLNDYKAWKLKNP